MFLRFVKCIMYSSFVLFSASVCWANDNIETEIGQFNIKDSAITETKFTSMFGKGCAVTKNIEGKIYEKKHIYYINDKKLWVELRFSHVLGNSMESTLETVLITKRKLDSKNCKPVKKIESLITPAKIQIGDSIENVIKAYGNPSITINVERDNTYSVLSEYLKIKKGKILRYLPNHNDESFFAEFYFDKRTLHSILISGEE